MDGEKRNKIEKACEYARGMASINFRDVIHLSNKLKDNEMTAEEEAITRRYIADAINTTGGMFMNPYGACSTICGEAAAVLYTLKCEECPVKTMYSEAINSYNETHDIPKDVLDKVPAKIVLSLQTNRD